MQKSAQRRGLIDKLREKTDLSGIFSEKFFDPELKDLMDKLRTGVDDPVRAMVSGKSEGESEGPEDGLSFKDILGSAQQAINKRKYMVAVSHLSKFHKRMKQVVSILNDFTVDLDTVHKKFLEKPLTEEDMKELHDLKSRWANENYSLVKEGGFLDLVQNLYNDFQQNKALSLWEKRYPLRVKKLKTETNQLMKDSQTLLNVTLNALSNMAKFRASRKIDNYRAESEKIIKKFSTYDESFKKYYQENVKGFLEKPEVQSAMKTDTSEKPQELGKQDIKVEPQVTAPVGVPPTVDDPALFGPGTSGPKTPVQTPIQEAFKQNPQRNVNVPGPQTVSTEPADIPDLKSNNPTSKNPSGPATIPSMVVPGQEHKDKTYAPVVVAHKKFIASLESLANESPLLLKAHICRYAKSIQNVDPETAISLFKIAQQIEE